MKLKTAMVEPIKFQHDGKIVAFVFTLPHFLLFTFPAVNGIVAAVLFRRDCFLNFDCHFMVHVPGSHVVPINEFTYFLAPWNVNYIF